MSVRLHYASRFASAAGTDREQVELDQPISVRELLESIAERHGNAFRLVTFASDGVLQPALMICVNDEHLLDPAEHLLRDGDEVLVLSAISGG
jgi:molybdopterin converting factor small subunit